MPTELMEFPSTTRSRPFNWAKYADGKIYQFEPEEGLYADAKKFRAAANAWATRNGYTFESEITLSYRATAVEEVPEDLLDSDDIAAALAAVTIRFTRNENTDSTEYVQALADAAAPGEPLDLPPGEYKVSEAVTVR